MTRTIPREVTREDIGWLAGIIDGEGSVTLAKPNVECTNKLIYGIHIVNSNIILMQKCKRIIDAYSDGLGKNILIMPKKYKSGIFQSNKEMFQLTVRRQGVIKNVLRAIIPHLTEKKLKSQRLLNFLEEHKKGTWFKDGDIERYLQYTPVETKRTALRKEMKL